MAFSIIWNVDADGDWNTTSNWSPAQLPSTTDNVGIDTTDFHTVTYSSGTSTVHSLTVGNDAFSITGGSLSVSAGASFSDALDISGGSLSLAGTTTVDGTFTNTGTVSLTQGMLKLEGGGSSTVAGIDLSAGTILRIEGDYNAPPTFTLNGGGTLGAAGSTVIVSDLNLSITADTAISGELSAVSTTISLGANNLSVEGAFDGPVNGEALAFIEGTGTLTLEGETDIFIVTMDGGGTTVFQGATALNAQIFAYNGWVVENQSVLTIADASLELDNGGRPGDPGMLKNDAGATIDLKNGGEIFDYSQNSVATNAGTIENVSGRDFIGAGISLTNTGSIVVQSGELDIGESNYLNAGYPIFENDGSTVVQSGTLHIADATIRGTGTITLDSGTNLILDESQTSASSRINIASGTGTANLAGGSGNDIFQFAGNFKASDFVDGGAGTDELIIAGNYAAGLTLGSATLQNVETIALATGHSYTITALDSLLVTGHTLTINASALGAANVLNFDGSAETSGHFIIDSGLGADNLTGGGGADTFVYGSAAQSISTHYDTIHAMNFNADKVDVPGVIKAVHISLLSPISSTTFDHDIAAAASGHLDPHTALYVRAHGGTLNGDVFLVVDVNGVAGYQAHGDLVIHLDGSSGSLSVADFI